MGCFDPVASRGGRGGAEGFALVLRARPDREQRLAVCGIFAIFAEYTSETNSMNPRHILPMIAMLLAALAFSCGSSGGYSDVFAEAEKRISEHPDSATSYLDSLAADTAWTKDMRESHRARFSLLRVKAADKAYVRHTSDSLIRTALAYYGNHTDSEHYPEALYYCGRVYSDLGDLPTALRYFQTALDAVPNNDENRKLRCHILSQTGRLLNSLRLYDKAIPYIEEVI